MVSGKNAFKFFRNEIGKHCVQRIPPTESNGRRQTSMVSVSVLKMVDNKAFNFDVSNVIIETFNAGGKGGQHSNKSDTAVRVKHKDIIVTVNGRSQHRNKEMALKILQSRLYDIKEQENRSKMSNQKREQIENIGRSDKVRTYNFIDSRVVDHKLNRKSKQIKKIMKGNLGLILNK
jgi:peptide chain release factor 1